MDLIRKLSLTMDLRQKALLGFVSAIIITMVVLASLSFFVTMSNYRNLESGAVRSDITLLSKGIDGEVLTLKSNTPDWGAWDDTYDFVLGKKPDYVSVNLVNATFRTLRANFIVITDKKGNILYGQGYDLAADAPVPLRTDIAEEVGKGSILAKTMSGTRGVSGFLSLPEGPVILSTFPILHSNYTGPMGMYQGAGVAKEFSIDEIRFFVPEPATMALLGFGLVFLRRKNS